MSGRLVDKYLAGIAAAAKAGCPDLARWDAINLGIELERQASAGGDPAWPDALAEEPYRGWAIKGVEMLRGQRARSASPSAARDWKPAPGNTHAAHAAGRDE